MANRQLLHETRAFQFLLAALAFALLLPVASAQTQDNSFSFNRHLWDRAR